METTNQANVIDVDNLKYFCRVCLSAKEEMIPLNENVVEVSEKDISVVSHVLSRVTKIKVLGDEQYPSYICTMCMEILNICYKFILQFEESQKLLDVCFKNKDLLKAEERQDQTTTASVELISSEGKYDLQDLVILEVVEDKKPDDFTGFLQNLGTEVSATFVNKVNQLNKLPKVNENSCSLSIITFKKPDVNGEINPSNNSNSNNVKSNSSFDRKTAKCEKCKKIYSKRSYLKRHERLVHFKCKETFICEICGVFLESKTSQYLHMRKHAGKHYECKACQKSYNNASNLRLHIKAVHKNERSELCTVCGKSFNYSSALVYHMRLHSGERNYKCTYCTKTFNMQCSLSRHLRVHTGNRPYKCKYCEKAFKSKGEVKCHEMIHTGFRPYHCQYCNKGFTKTYNLKVHLLSHGGDYVCKICNKSFIEISILKTHVRSCHPIPDTNEEIVTDDIDLNKEEIK